MSAAAPGGDGGRVTLPAAPPAPPAMSDRELLAAVGGRIRAARMKARVPQADLARMVLTTDVTISDWEHGKRDPGVCGLARVAAALRVPIIALLGAGAAPAFSGADGDGHSKAASPAGPADAGEAAAAAAAGPGAELTGREREIARLTAQGWGYNRIARHLFLAPSTVIVHLRSIRAKTGTHTTAQVIDWVRAQDEAAAAADAAGEVPAPMPGGSGG